MTSRPSLTSLTPCDDFNDLLHNAAQCPPFQEMDLSAFVSTILDCDTSAESQHLLRTLVGAELLPRIYPLRLFPSLQVEGEEYCSLIVSSSITIELPRRYFTRIKYLQNLLPKRYYRVATCQECPYTVLSCVFLLCYLDQQTQQQGISNDAIVRDAVAKVALAYRNLIQRKACNPATLLGQCATFARECIKVEALTRTLELFSYYYLADEAELDGDDKQWELI